MPVAWEVPRLVSERPLSLISTDSGRTLVPFIDLLSVALLISSYNINSAGSIFHGRILLFPSDEPAKRSEMSSRVGSSKNREIRFKLHQKHDYRLIALV